MQTSSPHSPPRRRGLTRTETAALLALAALAVVAARPILLHARASAPAAVCMANLRGLMQAWHLYAEDYDDQVVGPKPHDQTAYSLEPYPAYPRGLSRRVWNFVGTPHDENGKLRNNILEDELRGIRQGALWHYLEKGRLFHCPLDKRYTEPPTGWSGIWAGSQKGGYRSYSLGAVWNTYTEGWETGENLAVIYTTSQILDPASKIVYIEEADSCGYNNNTWNMFLNTRAQWYDPFAVFHDGLSMFGYADGRAEPRRWQNQSTIEMSREGRKLYPIPPNERDDIDWFRWRYVPGKMPDAFANL